MNKLSDWLYSNPTQNVPIYRDICNSIFAKRLFESNGNENNTYSFGLSNKETTYATYVNNYYECVLNGVHIFYIVPKGGLLGNFTTLAGCVIPDITHLPLDLSNLISSTLLNYDYIISYIRDNKLSQILTTTNPLKIKR